MFILSGKVLSVLTLLLMPSIGQLSWVDRPGGKFQLPFWTDMEELQSCVESGFEARYRIDMKLCKRHDTWLDSCKDSRPVIHRVSYERISKSFTLTKDFIGDRQDPVTTTLRSPEELAEKLMVTDPIALSLLARGDRELAQDKKAYISTFLETSCYGSFNRSFAELSYVLTFGILNIGTERSGWKDFSLRSLPLAK